VFHVSHVVLDCVDDRVDQVAHHLYRAQPSGAVTLATSRAVTLPVFRAQVIYPRRVIAENNNKYCKKNSKIQIYMPSQKNE
jgi:hypothetical protein